MTRPSKRQEKGRKRHVSPVLVLPDGSGFVSKPVRVGVDAMLKLSEEMLPIMNARPGAEEKRLREKCNVPFEL